MLACRKGDKDITSGKLGVLHGTRQPGHRFSLQNYDQRSIRSVGPVHFYNFTLHGWGEIQTGPVDHLYICVLFDIYSI